MHLPNNLQEKYRGAQRRGEKALRRGAANLPMVVNARMVGRPAAAKQARGEDFHITGSRLSILKQVYSTNKVRSSIDSGVSPIDADNASLHEDLFVFRLIEDVRQFNVVSMSPTMCPE